MRRLLFIVIALAVSAHAVKADSVILPARCVSSAAGQSVQPGPLTAHKILGARQHRTYTICARDRGGACRTLEIHRFDISCGDTRVPFRDVARIIIRERGVPADVASGRLRFELGSRPFSELNVLCDPGKELSSSDSLAVRRWNLDAECKQRSVVPRDVIELPSGFAPLATLGGQIVTGYQAKSGLLSAISTANAAASAQPRPPARLGMRAVVPGAAAKTSDPVKTGDPAKIGSGTASGTALETKRDAAPPSRVASKAAMALPGEALSGPSDIGSISGGAKTISGNAETASVDTKTVNRSDDAVSRSEIKSGPDTPEAGRTLLPRFASQAIAEVPVPIRPEASTEATTTVRTERTTLAARTTLESRTTLGTRTTLGNKATQATPPASPLPAALRVAAARNGAVTTSDANSWKSLIREVVSRQNSGDADVRQHMQHSMVATILGLALVTSLVSGIGWFATQQLLGTRKRSRDPYQVILRREVVDLAKPDAQMCGELCRTGQGLIGEINIRVDEIKGAAPLRRVLMREVRSMEQFLATTIETAPDDPKEWRRMRLRLQRVVTDLIRLKDITDGARRSLTTKIISDELPRDKQEAYEVLGANPEASEKILKRLVDALRATWHPDLAATDDDRELRDRRIKQINVAWDLITEKRGEA